MGRFYVYAIYEEGCAFPFYIGKGCGQRFKVHKHKGDPTRFGAKLRQLLLDGFEPEVQIIHDELEENEAFQLEQVLISQYKRLEDGGTLYNISEGGCGGVSMCESTRIKLSLARIGSKSTEETKRKVGEASLRSWTTERKQQMSKRMANNNLNKRYADSIKKKIIGLYRGRIIRQFDGLREAERAGFNRNCIRKVLDGKQESYRNMKWELI